MIEKAILQFSGGKDSTALMYYLDDLLDRIDVVFCDTGLILPEVLDHIHGTCDRLNARLTIIHPPEDIREFHKREGLPSDIVPYEQTVHFRETMYAHVETPIQTYVNCCYKMIMQPVDLFVRNNGYNTVIRGSKKCDARVGVPDGFSYDGVTYLSPIWDWSHEEVFAYLKQRGVELPPHYRYFPDSLDCYLCTGHLKHYGLERIEFIKKFHPDKWPELYERLLKVGSAVENEFHQFEYTVTEGTKNGR